MRTVAQCVEAGLVDGGKLHVDASLVDADAAKESVIKGAPQLIAALKRAYRATESKLEETSTPGNYQAVNDRMMSQSDPDAALVRKGSGDSRPRYQNHRVIDDQKGVITATEITAGSIAENKKLMDLLDQHEKNTCCQVQTVVADHKYGTTENYVTCQARGITTHMGDALGKARHAQERTIFGDEAFTYDPVRDIYHCPVGQSLKPRRIHTIRRTIEYKAPRRVCAACVLRAQCTHSHHGRTVQRHEKQGALDIARAQAHSVAARRDRKRRQHLIERSFADAANKPPLQTRPLAAALAPANPRLLDRGNPERAHLAGPSKSQAQRGGSATSSYNVNKKPASGVASRGSPFAILASA